jgi:hypothetical protein
MAKITRCEREWGPPKSPHICDLAKHHGGECRCSCDAKFDNRPAEVIIREDRDARPH